jgi:hypothetical protein
MATDDPNYLEWRAEEAIRLAQSAQHPAAVRAHYTMASHYLSRLYDDDGPQPQNKPSGAS